MGISGGGGHVPLVPPLPYAPGGNVKPVYDFI